VRELRPVFFAFSDVSEYPHKAGLAAHGERAVYTDFHINVLPTGSDKNGFKTFVGRFCVSLTQWRWRQISSSVRK
jgi:hypothetical protein